MRKLDTSMDEDIKVLANTIIDSQNSANRAAESNTVDLKKFFGPKLDELTVAINSASKSSGVLSLVIICLTAITTVNTISEGIIIYCSTPDFSALNYQQLECVMTNSNNGGDLLLKASLEYCERTFHEGE
jgi:hypothetical protein